ncbi:hypothetical protein NE236_06695 [Actinoallomurus purpureus]|uniref:hypothetical protein n=1 Tax=Actinoallomurus purpureus TaxID=478114 RepID=UPI002093FE7D|nr:hypothetical protein [Actinoallomurus purpureus]MCO6004664.1 hypothetical protein [Actinoallomurus purpureus]
MNDIDELVGRLARVRDGDLAGARHRPAARALLDQVTAATGRTAPARRFPRRLVLSATAAALAIGAVIGIGLGGPHDPSRHDPKTRNVSAVLAIQHRGKVYTVLVNDAFADRREYAKELRKAGLTVDLSVVPASPSLAGRLLGVSVGDSPKGPKDDGGDTSVDDYPVKCYTAPHECPLGLQISTTNPRIPIKVLLGRRARPGEVYDRDGGRGDVTAKGEALQGARIEGHTLAEVMALLRQHHLSVAGYRRSTSLGDGGGFTEDEASASSVKPTDRVGEVVSPQCELGHRDRGRGPPRALLTGRTRPARRACPPVMFVAVPAEDAATNITWVPRHGQPRVQVLSPLWPNPSFRAYVEKHASCHWSQRCRVAVRNASDEPPPRSAAGTVRAPGAATR